MTDGGWNTMNQWNTDYVTSIVICIGHSNLLNPLMKFSVSVMISTFLIWFTSFDQHKKISRARGVVCDTSQCSSNNNSARTWLYRISLTLKVLNFWKFTSYCSLKPFMVGHGGSSASSYLADPTSPIPSHCASIVATSTLRVNNRDESHNNSSVCI